MSFLFAIGLLIICRSVQSTNDKPLTPDRCEYFADVLKENNYQCEEILGVTIRFKERKSQVFHVHISGSSQRFFLIAWNVTDPVELAKFENNKRKLSSLDLPNTLKIHHEYQKDNFRLMVTDQIHPITPTIFDSENPKEVPFVHKAITNFVEHIENLHSRGHVFGNFNMESILGFHLVETKYSLCNLDFAVPKGELLKNVTPLDSIDPRLLADEAGIGVAADEAMDMFSLGGLVFKFIQENRPPFAGTTRQEILQSVQKGEITFQREVRADLAFLIHGLLRPDPVQRFDLKKVKNILHLFVNNLTPGLLKTPFTTNINQEFDESEKAKIMGEYNQLFGELDDDKYVKMNLENSKSLSTQITENFHIAPWILILSICLIVIVILAFLWLMFRKNDEQPAENPKENDTDRTAELVA